MNTEQKKFINNKIENCILIGNPGCGKTKTIIEYCIEKYSKKYINNQNNFLIISYSKKAQIDFIARGKKSKYPKLFSNKNIRTIHNIASHISKNKFNKNTENINTIILSTYKNLLNINDINILNDIYIFSNCKFIIVDEAQDINNNQYNLIKLISEKLNIPLILVGDPNQNIYQFQGGSEKFLLNHSKNIFYLTTNYRSSKEIIDFCNNIRPYNYLPLMVSNNNFSNINKKPLIYCNTIDNILNHIINEINNSKYSLEEIAIIGPVKKSLYKNNNYSSIGLQMICSILSKDKIQYVKHFKDGDDNDIDNIHEFITEKNHINILTCHSSKGLEFKKVILINYHFNTMSRNPTLYQYSSFKNLWYVGMTRAIEELNIYVDSEKSIFPEIQNIPKDLYILEGCELKFSNKNFSEDIIPNIYTITNIINNNKYFNENVFLLFQDKFKYNINNSILYNVDIKRTDIYEIDKYSCLYGLYIEKLFMYYYYKNNNNLQSFIIFHKNKLDNTLIFPSEYKNIFLNLKNKNIIDNNNNLYFNIIDKNLLSQKEYDFILLCKNKVNSNNITIYIENDLFFYDNNYICNLFNSLLNNNNNEKVIFDIVLYYYQLENECKYLLDYNFENNLNSLSYYYDKLNNTSKNYNNLEFDIYCSHNNIPLIGRIDILQDNKIIELKFVKEINDKHIIQTLLYYNNLYPNWKEIINIEIWNLMDGKKYLIDFEKNFTNWNLNCFICETLKIKMNNNIFILDIETNTIDPFIDFTNPDNTEIIDRYVYEYNLECAISDGLIKNQYPLTNSHIHGIYEKDLINSDNDYTILENDFNIIKKYCNKPIFIAHNGNNFDFKIINYHIDHLDKTDDLLFDTRFFLRLFIPNVKISNKLIDLYNFFMNSNIEQTHRAKEDTMLIVYILKKLNINYTELMNILKENNNDNNDNNNNKIITKYHKSFNENIKKDLNKCESSLLFSNINKKENLNESMNSFQLFHKINSEYLVINQELYIFLDKNKKIIIDIIESLNIRLIKYKKEISKRSNKLYTIKKDIEKLNNIIIDIDEKNYELTQLNKKLKNEEIEIKYNNKLIERNIERLTIFSNNTINLICINNNITSHYNYNLKLVKNNKKIHEVNHIFPDKIKAVDNSNNIIFEECIKLFEEFDDNKNTYNIYKITDENNNLFNNIDKKEIQNIDIIETKILNTVKDEYLIINSKLKLFIETNKKIINNIIDSINIRLIKYPKEIEKINKNLIKIKDKILQIENKNIDTDEKNYELEKLNKKLKNEEIEIKFNEKLIEVKNERLLMFKNNSINFICLNNNLINLNNNYLKIILNNNIFPENLKIFDRHNNIIFNECIKLFDEIDENKNTYTIYNINDDNIEQKIIDNDIIKDNDLLHNIENNIEILDNNINQKILSNTIDNIKNEKLSNIDNINDKILSNNIDNIKNEKLSNINNIDNINKIMFNVIGIECKKKECGYLSLKNCNFEYQGNKILLNNIEFLKNVIHNNNLPINILLNTFLLQTDYKKIIKRQPKTLIYEITKKGLTKKFETDVYKLENDDLKLFYYGEKKEDAKYTIIYDKLNKHYDVIKNNKIELLDNIYKDLSGNIYKDKNKLFSIKNLYDNIIDYKFK